MLNFFRNLFKKKSNIIDANDLLPTYTMAVTPDNNLILELKNAKPNVQYIVYGCGEYPAIRKVLLGFDKDKTVIDVLVYTKTLAQN